MNAEDESSYIKPVLQDTSTNNSHGRNKYQRRFSRINSVNCEMEYVSGGTENCSMIAL